MADVGSITRESSGPHKALACWIRVWSHLDISVLVKFLKSPWKPGSNTLIEEPANGKFYKISNIAYVSAVGFVASLPWYTVNVHLA